MTTVKRPARWQASDEALKAVQVAFDVEERVLSAVRQAAFDNGVSNSDQIRLVLGLSVTRQIKRPRLTVSLAAEDYELLGARYGLPAVDRLGIKERVTQDLVAFADTARHDKPKSLS